jgi:4-aminobutyrate aminotransferase-like enzyme
VATIDVINEEGVLANVQERGQQLMQGEWVGGWLG